MNKKKIIKLNNEKLRDLYLRDLSLGTLQGPPTGYPSIDKPWLKFYTPNDILTDIDESSNIYEYMYKCNKSNLDRIAINYYGRTYTYKELIININNVANKFRALGIKENDVISICMPSTPETIFSIYALNKIGAICDMIDPRSNPEQMEYYLSQNNSKILILCTNYYKGLKKCLDTANLKNIILTPITPSAPFIFKTTVDIKTLVDNFDTKRSNNVITWNNFMKIPGYHNVSTPSIKAKNDLAIIIHSSGTTSLPKGIILTNKNINALALQYKLTRLKTDPGSRFLSVIPAFASFGVVASINLPFTLSMENYLLPLVTPKAFYNNLVKNKINFTLTIPANFKYVARQKKKVDLSNLYGPGCGGYSLNSIEEEEINKRLAELGAPSKMLMGWGLSEAASTVCLETPDCAKILSSGIPLVKNTVSIFKPDTDIECKYYEEGEICVSGPTVMYGYLNNPEKTKKILKKHHDGKLWLHTGDLGYIDQDGRLTPVGRIERMIIKGIDGFKIFPQKIEEVIAISKYVDTCMVVGYNDKITGIIPRAYIVLKEEYKNSEEEAIKDIKNICLNKLSIRAVPEEFTILNAMPYTKMGKIDFKLLEKGYPENIEFEKKLTKTRKR